MVNESSEIITTQASKALVRTVSPGELMGRKVSLFSMLPRSVQTVATSIMEFARHVVLSPVKDQALACLKESATVNMDVRLRSLEQNLTGQKVNLKTPSGIDIQGMYFNAVLPRVQGTKDRFESECIPNEKNKVKEPSENGPTVLFFAGSDTSVFADSYETTIQAYLERGINVMVVDYPGVGGSKGNFSVKNSYDAAEAAFVYVQQKGVPNNKILVEGFSMGSGPASYVAAHHEEVNLLLRNPFVKMSEIGAEILRTEFSNRLMPREIATAVQGISQFALPYDNEKWISKITGSFGLLTAGDSDMFNKQLNTRERLLKAFEKSPASKEGTVVPHAPLPNKELRREEIRPKLIKNYETKIQALQNESKRLSRAATDSFNVATTLVQQIQNNPALEKNKAAANEKIAQQRQKEAEILQLQSAEKETDIAKLTEIVAQLKNGADFDEEEAHETCNDSIHMLTYAKSPELSFRLDTFLDRIGFFQ